MLSNDGFERVDAVVVVGGGGGGVVVGVVDVDVDGHHGGQKWVGGRIIDDRSDGYQVMSSHLFSSLWPYCTIHFRLVGWVVACHKIKMSFKQFICNHKLFVKEIYLHLDYDPIKARSQIEQAVGFEPTTLLCRY